MYPDERAKAVIQEIEAIKKEEEELHNALSRSPSLGAFFIVLYQKCGTIFRFFWQINNILKSAK